MEDQLVLICIFSTSFENAQRNKKIFYKDIEKVVARIVYTKKWKSICQNHRFFLLIASRFCGPEKLRDSLLNP